MRQLLFFACLLTSLKGALAADSTLDLSVAVEKSSTVMSVKTNLPPKTIMMGMLINPINQGGDGTILDSKAAVQQNQTVRFKPFSKDGKRLPEGRYVFHVGTVGMDLQPKEVQNILGVAGKNLTGPYVKSFYGLELGIDRSFWLSIKPDGSADVDQ